MSKQIQRRRGTTAEHLSFTGAIGEITIDTDKNVAVVHDGLTQGGFPLAKESDLLSKADVVHVHAIGDVTGLQAALDTKLENSSLVGLATETYVDSALAVKADAGHIHNISDVNGLQGVLDVKLEASALVGLATLGYVDSSVSMKADTVHGHMIADVVGLQGALDSKLDASALVGLATEVYVDTAVSNLVAAAPGALDTLNELSAALGNDPNFATTITNALAAKADAVHGHAIDDVTGLQGALDLKLEAGALTGLASTAYVDAAVSAKADAVHGHVIADVTGLQGALDAKADTSSLSAVATSGDYNDLINPVTFNSLTGVTAPVAGNVLRWDGANWTEGDVMPPSNIYFWVNEITGNDVTGNGSFNRPFKSIQAALDAYSGANGCVINVLAGSYIGDITVSKSGVTIIGVGSTDSQMIEILGHVTVSPGVTRFRARDIQFDGQTLGVPTVLFNGTAGRFYFDNCSFVHAGGGTQTVLQWTGNCERWHDFTICWIGGKADFGGTPLTSAQARFTLCDGDTSLYDVTHGNWTVRIQNTYRVGSINHAEGEIILHDIMEFTTATANAIVSTANNVGKNKLLLNGVNCRKPTGVFKAINKVGSCPYIISNTTRDDSIDTISGVPLHFGPYDTDGHANVKTVAVDVYVLKYSDGIILSSDNSARTFTLPPGVNGKMFVIKDVTGNASVNNLTILADGTETIDGASSYVINSNYGSVKLVWGNSSWNVIA